MKCPGPIRDGLPTGDPLTVASANVVVSARLVDVVTGKVIARFSNWPEPYRFLQPPDPGLMIRIKGTGENGDDVSILELKVERPVKCLVMLVKEDGDRPRREVKWSDNALDLFPGDAQHVTVYGLDGRSIQVAYFGAEKTHHIFMYDL